jgi:hypothetical protein
MNLNKVYITLVAHTFLLLSLFPITGNANSLNCASGQKNLPLSELKYGQIWGILQIDLTNRSEKQIGLGKTIQLSITDYYYEGKPDDTSEVFKAIWHPEDNLNTQSHPHKNLNNLMLGQYEAINSKFYDKAFLKVDKKGNILLSFLTKTGYLSSAWHCEIGTEGSQDYNKLVKKKCLEGWCDFK